MNAYQDVINRAQPLASQPYQPYTGNLVAGLSPDQQSAISEIEGAQGIATPFINSAAQEIGASTTPLTPIVQPYANYATGILEGWNPQNLQQAQQYFGNASTPITSSDIARYYDPYQKNVINATEAEFNNQNAQQLQGVRGNAVSQGAFGGDREAVAEGITSGQQQLAQAPVIAGLETQGFNTALSAAQQQKQMQQAAGQGYLGVVGASNQTAQGVQGIGSQLLGAQEANNWLASQAGFGLANLGNEAYNTTMSGANALLGVGGLEQQTAQEQLNVPYEQYLAAQAWPYQETSWLGGLATGVGGAAGGTSSAKYPGPSPVSQAAGLGLAGTSMLGMTGAFGSAGWLTGAGAAGGADLAAGTFSGISPAVDAALTAAAADTGAEAAGAGIAAAAAAKRGGRVPHRGPGGGISIPQLPAGGPGINITGGNGVAIPQLPTSGIAAGAPHGGGIASVNDYLNANKGPPLSQIIAQATPSPPPPASASPAASAPPPPLPISPAAAALGGQPPPASMQDVGDLRHSFPNFQGNATELLQNYNAGNFDVLTAAPTSSFGGQQSRGGGIVAHRDDGGYLPDDGGIDSGGLPMPPDDPTIGSLRRDYMAGIPEHQPIDIPSAQGDGDLPLPPIPPPQHHAAPRAFVDTGHGIAPPLPSPMSAIGGNEPLGGDTGIAAGVGTAPPPQRIGDTGEPTHRGAPWETLLAAGLGMMAGRSPYPGVNIGSGGLEGLKFGEQQRVREENASLRRLQTQELADYRRAMSGVAQQRANVGQQNADTRTAGTNSLIDYRQFLAGARARGMSDKEANDAWMQDFRTRGLQDREGNNAFNQQFRTGQQSDLNSYRGSRLDLDLANSIQRRDAQDQNAGLRQQTIQNQQEGLQIRRDALQQSKDAADKRLAQTATDADLRNATSLVGAGMAKDIPSALKQVQQGRDMQRPAAAPAPAVPAVPAVPARPQDVPNGSAFSPSRQMWRGPDGRLYDIQGRPIS